MSALKQTKSVFIIASMLGGLVLCADIYAEDNPANSCSDAAELFNEGDTEGALEEARWCVTQLEQLRQNLTSTYFRDEINGYTGSKLEAQNMMGMTMIERSYSKGDKTIKVSLTGSSGGGSNPLAALAQMGFQVPGEKVRIQRRNAVIDEDGSVNIMVTLKTGSMLSFESDDASRDEVLAFAKAFPVADLDDSLK